MSLSKPRWKHKKTRYCFRSKKGIQVLLDRLLVRAKPPIAGTRLKRRFGNPVTKKVA